MILKQQLYGSHEKGLRIGCIGVWDSSGKIRVSDLNTNNQEMPFYFWFHVKYFNNRINSKGFSTKIIPHKKKKNQMGSVL